MDYIGILKNAYQITIKNRFLWIFGFLAGGLGGFRGYNMDWPSGTTSSDKFSRWFESNNLSSMNWETFWTSYGVIVLTILALFLIFAVIMFILGIVSQGALVSSVNELSHGEKSDFRKGFSAGWKNFLRVWGMSIIYLLIILASLVLLLVPVTTLIVTGDYAVAIFLGSFIFIACLALWILIAIIAPYSLQIVVLKKLHVSDSIREALHLFRNNLLHIIIVYLLLLAVGIVFGIALTLALLIVGGVLFALGFALWLATPLAGISYGVVVGLAVFIALAVVSGAYNAFTSSVITLTYKKLTASGKENA